MVNWLYAHGLLSLTMISEDVRIARLHSSTCVSISITNSTSVCHFCRPEHVIASHHLVNIVKHVKIILLKSNNACVQISCDIRTVSYLHYTNRLYVVIPTEKKTRFFNARALTVFQFLLIVLFVTCEKSRSWIINLERTSPTKISNN